MNSIKKLNHLNKKIKAKICFIKYFFIKIKKKFQFKKLIKFNYLNKLH